MLLINPTSTLKSLLLQEDTDGDKKITIEDTGPKKFDIVQTNGEIYSVEGTYFLSNLLQELAILIKQGKSIVASISLERIYEKPTQRVSRLIRELYWDDLTRTMDKSGLEKVIFDEKVSQEYFNIYIPEGDKEACKYYNNLAKELTQIKVEILPKNISPEYVLSINEKPGLLALALHKKNGVVQGEPFVVPGGRFNEMYGWDSYFESIGLLIDQKFHLVKGMIENFEYQIKHYGKILNANRSYYLTRTQPPFYSSLLKEYVEATNNLDLVWLSGKLNTAIHEYENVWMVEGKRLTASGLNRYLAEGIGYVFETEEGHFKEVMEFYADKLKMPLLEFEDKYKKRKIDVPELDSYFTHDRTLRESGHDTSNRFVNKCAHLNTVDLNSLLYKYEVDFADLIQTYFEGNFLSDENKSYSSSFWRLKAEERKKQIDTLLWDEKEGLYFDYNFYENQSENFVSATTFYPLWSKLCSNHQAQLLVKNALPLLKCKGGIASSSKKSRGEITKENPQRQWDYPFGWAPHQMLIWKGLLQYNFINETQELVYRWLWLITKNAVNYNGTIPEKYDVVNCTHIIDTEYGNVGTNFEYLPNGGFGWMNASYQYGLSILQKELIEKLNELTDPDILFGNDYLNKD
ncbi:MAG: trehalase [Flavobacteriaceae bacterium]|nr:trehalase [Flavobacteriaceae bacterium]